MAWIDRAAESTTSDSLVWNGARERFVLSMYIDRRETSVQGDAEALVKSHVVQCPCFVAFLGSQSHTPAFRGHHAGPPGLHLNRGRAALTLL